jgi:N-acetyl-anhydromuramyl-L-alanine amidase AmpD
MAQSPEYPDLQWIPPRSYTQGRWTGQPTKITVHYTAGHEGYLDAENGALYDQRRTDGTSSHYYVDADSVVQCVRTTDRSHTALYHGNNEGIHYELCGTAQTREQWLDDVSRKTIRNAAKQMARDMRKYNIPLVRLVGRQVRDGAGKGVCGHYDWTIGWPEDGGTHTDPGTEFPWDVLFTDIKEFLEGKEVIDYTQRAPSGPPIAGSMNVGEMFNKFMDGVNASAALRAEVANLKDDLADLAAKVDAIQAGDPEVVAEKVAEKLAARLAS